MVMQGKGPVIGPEASIAGRNSHNLLCVKSLESEQLEIVCSVKTGPALKYWLLNAGLRKVK